MNLCTNAAHGMENGGVLEVFLEDVTIKDDEKKEDEKEVDEEDDD